MLDLHGSLPTLVVFCGECVEGALGLSTKPNLKNMASYSDTCKHQTANSYECNQMKIRCANISQRRTKGSETYIVSIDPWIQKKSEHIINSKRTNPYTKRTAN